MIHALMIGDNHVDIYVDDKKAFPGGACLSAAAYAKMCGHRAAFVSVVGNDALGALQLEALRSVGVDVSGCHILNAQTAWRKVYTGSRLGVREERSSAVLHMRYLSAEDSIMALVKHYNLIYTSSEGYFAPGAFELLGQSGIPVAHDFTDAWTEKLIREKCPHISYAFLSCDHVSETMTRQALRACIQSGACLAVATCGARGAVAYNGRRYFEQPAFPVPVVDSLGAGGAFRTCFILSYLDNKRVMDLSLAAIYGWDESREDYLHGLELLVQTNLYQAALFAAHTCQIQGAFGLGIPFEDTMVRSNSKGPYSQMPVSCQAHP